MFRRSGSWKWALSFVIALVCLSHANSAFAQGATGTITGTVVDSTGATLPGATVNVTEAATGTIRTSVTDEAGLFRFAALNPGRYNVAVELANFRTLNVADVTLLSTETRDLGKLALQVGGLTETVTITSEVTPVQVADSSRRSTLTTDDIATIPTKGRDIFGMLGTLPGVQDTNLNRDFTQWRSAISITINGMPSQTKDVRVDGINIVDEGGCGTAYVNLNMDAVGEVQVIANGYTAENGRNNGGVISMVTKAGTNQLRASASYNGRRDKFNENDYFREATNQPKPLYRVNISSYNVGGPVVIPGMVDSRRTTGKKFYFFVSQEFVDDARPTTTTRANMPTGLEYNGDFSATRFGTTAEGTLQVITDPITGQPFPNNRIPAAGTPGCGVQFSCIDPLGQRMLRILPEANGILNPAANQQWTSNSAYDLTPVHGRTNNVIRVDSVFTDKTRMALRFVKDRDDDWSWNRLTPGTGFVNQNTPGLLISSTISQVLKPTVVNEIGFGYTHNRWGFKAADDFDYRSLYRSALNVDPPRFEPFADYSDPPKISGIGEQVDEWPYAPRFTTGGGNRSGLAGFRTLDEPIPRLNLSGRFYFNDDLSMTRGRHNFKMGVSLEYNRKTEPGSADYMGNFNFGHDANNPLSTGNGYANMLLGVFTTYTELTSRVDRDVRHWQNDFYFQDNWRVSPRLTVDLGLRVQHSGSDFETNNMNSGFFDDLWQRNNAARVYKLACTTGVPGNQACAAANQRAIDPANPGVFFPTAYAGNIVPGSGQQLNGIITGGMEGRKDGTYFTFPYFVYAPRAGMAWNMTGDGKTALRASWGIFYNFPRSTGDGGYPFSGGCPISCTRQIRWARFNDITAATPQNLIENPVNVTVAGYEQPLSKSHNVNVAFQRDIGFNTVAEIAWVGNYTWNHGRFVDDNRLPLYVYADPNNLVNNAPIAANSLRGQYGKYPGMGSANLYVPHLYAKTLQYNAMQLQLARRLTNGLQMGFSYTLAKGEGYRDYDPYTDQIGGEAAIRARYWGPTNDDRRHNISATWSYDVPTWTETPVLKQLLMDWQISGIFRMLSGQALTPSCTSNTPGINNSDPSLSGLGTGGNLTNVRCELTGEPIFSGYTVDTSLPEADRLHFNPAAFRMPQPNGGVGNFGNTPVGILRHPTWHEWDLTLSRRFPINLLGRKDSGVRLRYEVYNVFNEVQFTNLNASFTYTTPAGAPLNSSNTNANTGKYTATGTTLAAGTITPRVMALTVRFDW
jgi:hypothetical protein